MRVVQRLKGRLDRPDVDVVELGTAGLSLLDEVAGYDRLILVDAIVTGAVPGTVHVLGEDEVATTVHLGASHEADLATTLAWGRKTLGSDLPRDVVVVAVEAADLTTFSERLTPAVASALEEAERAVLALVT